MLTLFANNYKLSHVGPSVKYFLRERNIGTISDVFPIRVYTQTECQSYQKRKSLLFDDLISFMCSAAISLTLSFGIRFSSSSIILYPVSFVSGDA